MKKVIKKFKKLYGKVPTETELKNFLKYQPKTYTSTDYLKMLRTMDKKGELNYWK